MSDSDSSSSESMASVRQPGPPKAKRRDPPQTPQQKIDEFWSKYKTKAPGKATSVIPQNECAERAAKRASAKSKAPAKTTQQSYEEAAEQCRRKVAQIVKECRRVNQKYRDPHFDLELDLKFGRRDCLDSLDNERNGNSRRRQVGGRRGRDSPLKDRLAAREKAPPPKSGSSVMGLLSAVDRETTSPTDGDRENVFRPTAVKRVVDIFDNPQFFINGPTANDVRQGRDGDCWLMAALCTLSNKSGLIERCCIAHDVDVGVYGFVFHRDGEWFSEIIDDKLYLTKPDYDEALLERILWEDRERVNSEEAYRKIYQSNSGALYFAQCEDPNETWLPLLEKAYAKAHGDYSAIEGGYGGEGIEDLTGGVTSEIYTTDILDKEHFWNEELMKVNKDFLFGCSTGVWGRGWGEREGIVELHAYSVLKAREIDGIRLVLLKNPWGKHEWKGAWSDGSKEWTAEWLQKLGHKFGDDGSFWISYEDLLKKYQAFDRTRLFGPEWKVSSIWTTLDVSWTLDYHDTKFAFTLAKSGPVVIVFSQLDERYFRGLEGQYRFELGFRVHKAGEEDYVVRSQNYYRMNRSVNVELDLAAGEYVVVVKMDAQRNERLMPVEEVVRAHAKERREKLLRVGLAYDVAHSKGKVVETDGERAAREAYRRRKREADRRRLAEAIRRSKVAAKRAEWRAKVKKQKKAAEAAAKAKAKAERRAARRRARAKDAAAGEGGQGTKGGGEEEAGPVTTGKPVGEGGDNKPNVDGKEDTQVDADEKKPGERQDKTSRTKHEDVAAAPNSASDEKHVKIETPDAVISTQAEGSTSSTDPGVATPASSTAQEETTTTSDEDMQEVDENYVTAAEETDNEKTAESTTEQQQQQQPLKEGDEPDTPRATAQPSLRNIPNAHNAPDATTTTTTAAVITSTPPSVVDVGVQTGPGLPRPPPPPPPPPPTSSSRRHHRSHRGPPPGVSYSYLRPPPRDLSHVPPHLRAAYVTAHPHHNSHYPSYPYPPPRVVGGPPSDVVSIRGSPSLPPSSSSSINSGSGSSEDDEEDEEEADDANAAPSDVSDVSDAEIETWLADAEAMQAVRAAAAAAVAGGGGGGGGGGKNGPGGPGAPPGVAGVAETPTEEDLLLDEFERDPWNAVGVFGLRVYYKVAATTPTTAAATATGQKEEGEQEQEQEQEVVRLRVERPNPYVWDESDDDDGDDDDDDDDRGGAGGDDDAGAQADDEKEGDGAEETKVLDVDDSAKDAVGEEAGANNHGAVVVGTPGGEKKEGVKEGDEKEEEKEEEKEKEKEKEKEQKVATNESENSEDKNNGGDKDGDGDSGHKKEASDGDAPMEAGSHNDDTVKR